VLDLPDVGECCLLLLPLLIILLLPPDDNEAFLLLVHLDLSLLVGLGLVVEELH